MARKHVAALTGAFIAILAVIALLARATALGTTGAWFSAAISSTVYQVTLLSATALVIGLGILASIHTAMAAREVRALELKIAILRGSGIGVGGAPGGISLDNDIDDTLDQILGVPMETSGALVAVRREGHDSLTATMPMQRTVVRGDVLLKELSRAKNLLVDAGSRVWGAVAGPMAIGAVFLGIAGAMLPGSDGFAAAHYQLNTAVILFLGYGWPFLVTWAAVSLGLARIQEGKHT